MTPLQLKQYFSHMGFNATLTNGNRSIVIRRNSEDITSRDIVEMLDSESWQLVDQIINMRRANDDSFDYVKIRLVETAH